MFNKRPKLLVCLFCLLAASPTLAAPAANNASAHKKNSAKTVAPTVNGTASDLYLKARELFAAGRYADALNYANAARKKNKNLTIAYVLMAQSYYRLGDVRKAGLVFLKIPIQDLPKEAAVDYLLTMYSIRKYREVIKVYPLVPDQHPYKDVAKFYTGVSLLQFKLLNKSHQYVRNAKKLPPSLKSQRRRILKEIAQAQREERQGQFDAQQYSYQNQQVYLPPPVAPEAYGQPVSGEGTPSVPKTPKEEPPPPPPPKASTKVSVKPAVSYKQVSTRTDFGGYKLVQKDEKAPETSMNIAVKFTGKPRSFGGQPSLDLSATPQYSHSDAVESTSELSADEADPTAIINKTTKTETAKYTNKQSFKFGGAYPVSDPFELSAGYSIDQSEGGGTKGKFKAEATKLTVGGLFDVDDFKLDVDHIIDEDENKLKTGTKKGSTTTQINAAHQGENSVTSLDVKLVAQKKPDLVGEKGSNTYVLKWTRSLDDLSLNLSATKTELKLLPVKRNFAIQNQTSFGISADYDLNLGLTLNITGNLYQYSNLVVKDKDVEAMGSGSGRQFAGTVKLSPVSFVSISAAYDVTDKNYSVGNPALVKPLRNNLPSQEIKTTLSFSANYTF